MRKEFQAMKAPSIKAAVTNQTLKFGSLNINGLDIEAGWAAQQLLTNRGFDVSLIHKYIIYKNNMSSPGTCTE